MPSKHQIPAIDQYRLLKISSFVSRHLYLAVLEQWTRPYVHPSFPPSQINRVAGVGLSREGEGVVNTLHAKA
jgi:hypothetical protein